MEDSDLVERVLAMFDHHAPEFAGSWPQVYEEMRDKCPVLHSAAHGGYFVLSRYEDVIRAGRDWETFSSAKDGDGSGPGRQGIMIPPYPARLSMAEVDPPVSLDYRKVLLPRFSQREVDRHRVGVAAHTHRAVDRFIERGSFDVMTDLANVVPAYATLDFMGLPIDAASEYADVLHRAVYLTPADSGYADVVEGIGRILADLAATIADHRKNPKDDLVTYLIDSRIGDSPLDDVAIQEMLFVHLTGGFDTTTALIALGMLHLSSNPDDRARFAADPSVSLSFVDEVMRFYCPSTGIARTVTRPVELSGVQLAAGDRVFLAWGSANRDQAKFRDPDRFIIDRPNNAHVGFGSGVHRCIGANLARMEAEVVIRTVFDRLPDYVIDMTGVERYPSIGIANSYIHMPATFTPGRGR
jgi:cytochrome P450